MRRACAVLLPSLIGLAAPLRAEPPARFDLAALETGDGIRFAAPAAPAENRRWLLPRVDEPVAAPRRTSVRLHGRRIRVRIPFR